MAGTDTLVKDGVRRDDRTVTICTRCKRDCHRVEWRGISAANHVFSDLVLCEQCYGGADMEDCQP